MDLVLREHSVADEHFHVLRMHERRQRFRRGLQVRQAPAFGFLHPGCIIAVAVENDAPVVLYSPLDQFAQVRFEIGAVFEFVREL